MAKQDKDSRIKVTERDRRAIVLVAKLTEKELFGLECYLAGTRAAQREATAAGAAKVPDAATV